MEALGGGGSQSAFGFQLQSYGSGRTVGLAAGVGEDLPASCQEWLQRTGVDQRGLLRGALPTPRAWQICEWDGKRTQVWRTEPSEALYEMLRPDVAALPEAYRAAASYHCGVHPERPSMEWLGQLRAAARRGAEVAGGGGRRRGLVSIEPFTHAENPVPASALAALCSAGDVFSPNQREAISLVGAGPPEELARRLGALGAAVVALRRGAEGSLVLDSGSGEMWAVPALPVAPVDETGCGNSYCGAFLAALQDGEDLASAAAWGSVAASFMLQHRGVPPMAISELREEARQRFETLRAQADCLHPAAS